jgi:ABC-2 type transport system permease protein
VNARKIKAVARHEFITTVTRVGYLVTLVGMPLFIGAVGAISGAATSSTVLELLSRSHRLGVVDETGLYANAPLRVEPPPSPLTSLGAPGLARTPSGLAKKEELEGMSVNLIRYASLAEAKQALLREEVEGLLRIPPDYLARGRVEEYRRARKTLALAPALDSPARMLRSWLVAGLLAGRVDPAFAARASRPARADEYVVEPDGRATEQDMLRELRPLLVPMGFALFLMLSIFTSASYLATGLAEEKQNRALEMLLTSITPEELFWGKLFGLWLAALLQFVLYLLIVALPAALIFAALGLKISLALIGLTYFILGFFFFGAVLLAVGAIGNTQKYTQQLSGLFTFTAIVPFMMLPALLNAPAGRLARVLTYIPFTAPITGMLRAAAGALPWWELALSLLSLSLGTVLVIRACSKIFRVALLATGGVSLGQVIAWLRE